MFEEKPDVGPVTIARGAASTFGDIYEASVESGRRVDNIMAGVAERERAYDRRIDDIKKVTGIELTNPVRDWQVPGLGPSRGDRMAAFDERIKGLEQQFPEHAGVIRGTISPDMEAREGARAAERRLDDASSRYDGWSWVPSMLGGFRASLEDPANMLAMMVGPWGRAGTGIKGLFWMATKQAVANMGVEAASQPIVQKWRKDAGLDYGISRAAMQVGAAGVFGFGLDAGIRGGYRVLQHSRGREPILDAKGGVEGYRPRKAPEDALEDAAKAASPNAMIRKAADGDIDAIHSVGRDAGVSTDPAIRGARAAAEIERELAPAHKFPEGVDPSDGLDRLAQSIRASIDPREPLPVAAPPVAKPRPDLADDTAMPAGAFVREGKPVTLERLDPRAIGTDPEAFQFKRGGDGQGEIGTLAGVERWDPMASNRVIVFERADGTRVIADGHQRLGLARRLADQAPILDGFVMREADGWTAADVRAYAAQKNLKEGSGSIVDAATVIRERPDIIDGSVPLNNAAMRQARALSRLSDDAFGQVVAGTIDPVHAALVADLVGNRDLHAGFLAELVKARPDNLRQARIMIGDMLEAGNAHEVQQTLFGVASFQRPMMAERAAVLDRALKTLGDDAKIFGLVDREADRLRGAGNRIARGNAERAAQAENLGEIVEKLARRAGPVSDWLGDAARAVDAGMKAADAAEAFVARLRREIGEGGLAALEREASPKAGLDDVSAKGTAPLADAMDARFDLLIKDMKKAAEDPAAPSRDQEVMFAIRERRLEVPYAFRKVTKKQAQELLAELEWRIRDVMERQEGLGQMSPEDRAQHYARYRDEIAAVLPKFDLPTEALRKPFKPSKIIEAGDFVVRTATDERHIERAPVGDFTYFVHRKPSGAARTAKDLGAPLGSVGFHRHPDGRYEVAMVELKPSARGKGVAAVMYDAIEKDLGIKLQPSGILLPDGLKFWSRRNPEAVKYHQRVTEPSGGYEMYLSPKRLLADLDDASRRIAKLAAENERAIAAGPSPTTPQDAFDQAVRVGRDELQRLQKKVDVWSAALAAVPDAGKTSEALSAMFARADRRAAVDAALLKGEFGHTARAAADMAAIRADVEKAVRKVAPRDVGIRLRDAITEHGDGVEGFFDPHERLIHIALTAADPLRVGYEEAGHALKRAGLFTAEEYRLLTDYAARHNLRAEFDIEGRYGPVYGKRWEGDKARIEAAYVEETVMQMLAHHATGDRWGTPAEQTLIAKLADRFWKIVDAIKAALGVRGIRTVDDVFRAFEDGTLGARTSRWPMDGPTNIRDIRPDDLHPPGPVTGFHGTYADFETFRPGQREFGVHFGSAPQAETRLLDVAEMAKQASPSVRRAIAPDAPRTIPVVIDMKRPLDLPDLGDWSARNTLRAIKDAGVPVDDALVRVLNAMADAGEHATALDVVSRVLTDAGYDGIRYLNQVEGAGWSYIAFKPGTVKAAFDPGHVWFALAGEKAASGDRGALARAKAMDKAGASREEIWQAEGWFKGVDGKWRFEISDDRAGIDRKLLNAVADGRLDDVMASELLPHDPLFRAYPELAYLTTQVRKGEAGGSYGHSVIEIGTRESRGTMLHELQHGVQAAEGFARGGSPDTITADDIRVMFQALREGDRGVAVDEMTYEAYRRFAGETEARVVEKRMDMTPAERRARPPWLDYDVEERHQIVRMLDEGAVSFSVQRQQIDEIKDAGELVGACKHG